MERAFEMTIVLGATDAQPGPGVGLQVGFAAGADLVGAPDLAGLPRSAAGRPSAVVRSSDDTWATADHGDARRSGGEPARVLPAHAASERCL